MDGVMDDPTILTDGAPPEQTEPEQTQPEQAEPTKKQRPNIQLPDDFTDEAAFLQAMRLDYADDMDADKDNRDAGLEDQKFLVGDQWDANIRARRDAAKKPCLTVNRLVAFISQVCGHRRLNETTIKVVPDNGGTKPIARIREGLIRSIQKICRAKIAYDKAQENQVICGIGNFQVELDWESDEVWTQVIKISSILNPFAVVWDRMLTDPTGSDADHVSVVDSVTKREYEKRWPWAEASDIAIDSIPGGELRAKGWFGGDDVRIVFYWRMRTKRRTIALMNDGTTKDITDEDPQAVLPNIIQRKDGSPVMREIDRKYAEGYRCSGLNILEGPYRLPISRVPVFRVPGWEVVLGETKYRWGLVRFLKDPQRLHNYWRSVIAEKIMQTPRANWLASDTAVAGREKAYREAHTSDDPLLIWNSESGNKPERVQPAQVEESLLGQSEVSTQDLKDVSNIHEANLGMPSNEVSGAAIIARQRVSDTGTVLYHDNLGLAIEQAGVVINELIDVTYDTPRIIKVLGDDAKEDLVIINDGEHPDSVDISTGKYSVSVVTGPTSATKRIEAAASMEGLANAAPQLLSLFADLYVEAQDWPLADKIAARIRSSLPPGVLDPKDMTPEQQQAAQQAQADQAEQHQLMISEAVAKYMKLNAEAALAGAKARQADTQSEVIPQHEATASVTAASLAAERELKGRLETIRVAHGV